MLLTHIRPYQPIRYTGPTYKHSLNTLWSLDGTWHLHTRDKTNNERDHSENSRYCTNDTPVGFSTHCTLKPRHLQIYGFTLLEVLTVPLYM